MKKKTNKIRNNENEMKINYNTYRDSIKIIINKEQSILKVVTKQKRYIILQTRYLILISHSSSIL